MSEDIVDLKLKLDLLRTFLTRILENDYNVIIKVKQKT
jgi:hypothetical protein